MTGKDLAIAAERLMGTPFRLHGRDPRTGLDCIGLLEAVFLASGMQVSLPTGYSLRTGRWQNLEQFSDRLGFAPGKPPLCSGDICLLRPSPVQMHFAIIGTDPRTMVEAHAGLRKVVISPLPDGLAPEGLWRLASEL